MSSGARHGRGPEGKVHFSPTEKLPLKLKSDEYLSLLMLP